MHESQLIGLASIIILGIGAQWLSWRFKIPSILLLLIFGFLAGPVFGILDPDDLMGDLLFPVISFSVAIILFEGGLSLRVKELKEIGKTILALITVGLLITWVIGALTAYYILGLNIQISVLLGAILVVTGPTVIGPMLRHIQPVGKVGDLLKWEGIMIDPIGAMVAVLVFEVILVGGSQAAGFVIGGALFKTIVLSGSIGIIFAAILIIFFKKYWIPDSLHETATLTLVVGVYLLAEFIQEESGLFAVTIMGFVLGNQNRVTIKHVVEFKENLRLLIISSLFIILAARLELESFTHLPGNSLILLVVLVLVARPLSAFLSTLNTRISIKEKVFLSWMAPRGIVAAAVSSFFALRLAKTGLPQTEFLVPLTFIVIVGTVVIYGLTSYPLARLLNISQSNPQGILFLGAHSWAVDMARAVQEKKIKVIMIDSNSSNVYKAKMAGIQAYYGNIISKRTLDNIDLNGIGRLIALTPNDEANSLAVLHLAEIFSREELYQLVPNARFADKDETASPMHLRGRFLFGKRNTFQNINKRYLEGSRIKSTRLTKDFDYAKFRQLYGRNAILLFVIKENKSLMVITSDTPIDPKPGQTLIALVDQKE